MGKYQFSRVLFFFCYTHAHLSQVEVPLCFLSSPARGWPSPLILFIFYVFSVCCVGRRSRNQDGSEIGI